MRKLALLFMVVLFASFTIAQECAPNKVHFFYSKTCGHCAKQKPVMEQIDRECEAVCVHFYPVSEESELWEQFAEDYGVKTGGVPMTFVAGKAFIGYSESDGELQQDPVTGAYIGYKNQILEEIEEIAPGCVIGQETEKPYAGQSLLAFVLLPLYLIFAASFWTAKKRYKRQLVAGFFIAVIISFFIFIVTTPDTVIQDFAQRFPFPLFVAIIALADGFNPCAFTVLIILLSLLTYTKNRKDMFTIGTTFILTSAVMYFIFIMLMISIGSRAIEAYGTYIMIGLGIAITIAALINLKDFFLFKKGITLGISDKQKQKIMKRAGKITKDLQSKERKMFWVAIGATVLLAGFVNLVELGCTAILPMVYMASLVTSFGRDALWMQLLWTGLYSLIYILPLYAILINFILSFRSTRLTERQGRILKLVAGLFMLFFGMIMIFNPQLLQFG